MNVKSIMLALLLGIAITALTAILPPLWVPNRASDTTYMGWPLPWVVQNTAYNWLPIIGPLMGGVLTSFDLVFLGIDIAFWTMILSLILEVSKRGQDAS